MKRVYLCSALLSALLLTGCGRVEQPELPVSGMSPVQSTETATETEQLTETAMPETEPMQLMETLSSATEPEQPTETQASTTEATEPPATTPPQTQPPATAAPVTNPPAAQQQPEQELEPPPAPEEPAQEPEVPAEEPPVEIPQVNPEQEILERLVQKAHEIRDGQSTAKYEDYRFAILKINSQLYLAANANNDPEPDCQVYDQNLNLVSTDCFDHVHCDGDNYSLIQTNTGDGTRYVRLVFPEKAYYRQQYILLPGGMDLTAPCYHEDAEMPLDEFNRIYDIYHNETNNIFAGFMENIQYFHDGVAETLY